jgi:hypothetical protein
MQSAEDRIGTHCIGFPVAMARTGLLVVAPRGRRIGNTRTERHVRAPGIVMGIQDLRRDRRCDSDSGINQPYTLAESCR